MSQLADYIKRQLTKGYNITTIRNFLINRGYNKTIVDNAISEIYAKDKSPNHKIRFFIIIFIILIITLTTFLIFQLTKSQGSIFSINLETKNNYLFDNEPLFLKIYIHSKKTTNINLRYEITKFGIEKVIFEKEVKTKVSKNKVNTILENISISNLSTSTYRLKVSATSNGIQEFAYSTFIIKERLINVSQKIENKNITHNVSSEKEIKFTKSTEITKDNKTKELEIQEIINLGLKNPKKAEELCITIKDINKSDECLTLLVQKTKKSDFCSKISTVTKKDGCYANLAIEGNFNLCEKIEDQYQREACKAISINQG